MLIMSFTSIYGQTHRNPAVNRSKNGDQITSLHDQTVNRTKDAMQSGEVSHTNVLEKPKKNISLCDHLFEYIQKQAIEDAKKTYMKATSMLRKH